MLTAMLVTGMVALLVMLLVIHRIWRSSSRGDDPLSKRISSGNPEGLSE